MSKVTKIIRRQDKASGGITDEEKARMAEHVKLWVARAMRTAPIDREKIIPAIESLYAAANLRKPRVVIVPSPFVMAMAGGISALVWHLGKQGQTKQERAATSAATSAATRAATRAATYAATRAATYDATDAATYAATSAATDAATYAATYAATSAADWLGLAAEFVGEEWALTALKCAKEWYGPYQGGNMWPAWDCYLTAYRDILGLRLAEHEKYAAWEQCAIEGGFRWMHEEFCLVSDFPETLKVNSRNQPHAELGPSHRWRDGFSIWHLNGVLVEPWMAEQHPDDLDARKILQIENVDQRRECIRRLGSERLTQQLDAKVLHTENREVGGNYELLAIDMNFGDPWRFLKMNNPSIDAVHVEAVPRECETVTHAINWRKSQNINQDWFPSQLA
jgi:hypothetical protein